MDNYNPNNPNNQYNPNQPYNPEGTGHTYDPYNQGQSVTNQVNSGVNQGQGPAMTYGNQTYDSYNQNQGQPVNPYIPNQTGVYANVQPGVQSPMPPQNPDEMTKEDEQKANFLCGISLICHFGLPLILSGITGALGRIASVDNDVGVAGLFMGFLSTLSGLSVLASWILMIYVRVKYRKSVFGKVLMWLYIGLILLLILAVIIFVAACINLVRDCQGCPG